MLLSPPSYWHLKPLAFTPRCSAASKIITLKVGQKDLDFSALMCACPDAELERSPQCSSHAVHSLSQTERINVIKGLTFPEGIQIILLLHARALT